MTKQNIITWVILMVLTITAGMISNAAVSYLVPFVLLFAVIKFLGVTFNFMELKKANLFWQLLIVGYLLIFCITVIAILQ